MFNVERWRPYRGLNRQRFTDFDALVSRFFDEPFLTNANAQTWTPSAEILETDEHIKVYLDLPGMNKDNINIEVTGNNTLVIRGERKFEEEDKSKYHRVERFYGNFTRSFVLPSTVEMDKINATFKDGVLEVVLPKAESARTRRIEVKTK
jgi:HSP20 family protein